MTHFFRHVSQLLMVVLLLVVLSQPANAQAVSAVTLNAETTTYDFHPVSTTTDSGATWYAWHGYSNGRDQIFARRQDAAGTLGSVHTLSQSGPTHGPPRIIGHSDETIRVVWSTKLNEDWRVVMCRHREGLWTRPTVVSDPNNDAIYPNVVDDSKGNVIAAWSEWQNGKWRVRSRRITESGLSPTVDLSSDLTDAFRTVLVHHEGQIWAFWDQYDKPNYSVHGRVISPTISPVEMVSPADEYCLTPTAISHKSGLHVAWLRKDDVEGGPRVISQWHSLHAAVRSDTGWQPITTDDGGTTAADLTQGLMAKIDPKAVATGGYLGPRVRPSLLSDGDRVWLLWERKSDHRGSTPRVFGDLVGRPSRNGRWETPVVLQQGRVDYHAIDPPVVSNGKLRILASPLPRKGIRHYEIFDVAMAEAQPFEQETWTGWSPVKLPIDKESTPRREITAGGKTYKLYWADMHCHNGLTADAEGQPDELQFYARDRADLDVVVFTNNDFYNVPLTQYEFELGNLFANTFSAASSSQSGKTEFLSLPGYEWTSRIPGVSTAENSDPGNWLPPYQNRSYPNHRSVIYPPGGGPLVHFMEVGNDIAWLNEAVAKAGGITLSQHNAFRLSGHPVEVGLELTSGWSNYIASHPKLFHGSLDTGARLGFVANGDTHRRAPGLSGALTGIYAEELSAASILDALRSRRCFATMGSQIFLDARADGTLMGTDHRADSGNTRLTLHAIGTRPIRHARLIRNGKTIYEVQGNGGVELEAAYTDKDLSAGTHWYYWSVTQSGPGPVLPGNLMPAHGPVAWSSPNWVVVE